jgi:death on curing protein
VSVVPARRVHHLTVPVVIEIHSEAISNFGGSAGIREMTLLEAAVAAPRASSGGKPAYHDPIEMAAAYLFFLCRNSPFLDGIKRTALGSCLVFLRLNAVKMRPDGQSWEDLTLKVASFKLNHLQATLILRSLTIS